MNNKFPGFPKEPITNYWPYPKALNGWWHKLNGSEQKVLDYILRHTWGFKKTADKISISQFCTGIANCDKGTGLSKNSVIKSLKSLEENGFIKSVKESYNKQYFTTLYQLVHLDDLPDLQIDGGVVQNLNYPSAKNEQGGSAKFEHTIKDNTIKDLSINNNIIINGKQINELIGLFEPVNPSYGRLFANKGQRQAMERLFEKHGYEKIKWVMDKLPELAKNSYAPIITNPFQLEAKLGQLIIFLGRENNKGGGVTDARHIK